MTPFGARLRHHVTSQELGSVKGLLVCILIFVADNHLGGFEMNLLKDKKLLRTLIKQGDLMNTVYGGVRQTDFRIEQVGDDLMIRVSNPSIKPEAFHFTIQNNRLYINGLHKSGQNGEDGESLVFPVFSQMVTIPFFVDITKIEGIYEHGEFRIYLPYNKDLPKGPTPVNVRFTDH